MQVAPIPVPVPEMNAPNPRLRSYHRGDDSRGAGALVRMQNISEATEAILALNGQVPRSLNGEYNTQPLLVRYADSPEEKARKQARKELQSGRQHRHALLHSSILHGPTLGLVPFQYNVDPSN